MNNTALAGIIVGAVVIAAAGAIAANSGFNPLQKYATVVAVEPAYETSRTPRQVCGEDPTLGQSPIQEEKRSEEKPVAKAEAKTDATSAEPCVMVYDTQSIQAGYDVTYELDGIQKVVRMDHEPGKRIPVEDGELVLTQS